MAHGLQPVQGTTYNPWPLDHWYSFIPYKKDHSLCYCFTIGDKSPQIASNCPQSSSSDQNKTKHQSTYNKLIYSLLDTWTGSVTPKVPHLCSPCTLRRNWLTGPYLTFRYSKSPQHGVHKHGEQSLGTFGVTHPVEGSVTFIVWELHEKSQ